MVEYILSLAEEHKVTSLPVEGTYSVRAEKQGVVIARAAYTDKGANGIPPIGRAETFILQAPDLPASDATIDNGVNRFELNDVKFMIGTSNGAYVGFEHLDLTGIAQMNFTVSAPAQYGFAGGVVEVRIDSPDGPVIGTSGSIVPTQSSGGQNGPPPAVVRSSIQPTKGFHDLYFVYRKPGSPDGVSLFVLVNIGLVADQKAMASR
jgi:cytochrome c